MLDTTFNIETPEGVELQLPVAGLAPRSLAWLIDSAIKFGAILLGIFLLNALGELGEGILLLLFFSLNWGYNVLFEVLMQGATPGKRAVGVRVMYADGTPISWRGAMIRNLIRPVDVFPGCYLFGCISVLLTRQFQRLGDLAAGTVVVYLQEVPVRNLWKDSTPSAPMAPLNRDEQEAIVSFGERCGQISAARAEELSAILEPVLGPLNAEQLRGYGAWIAGYRNKP